jgi:hypothetical protein
MQNGGYFSGGSIPRLRKRFSKKAEKNSLDCPSRKTVTKKESHHAFSGKWH